MLNDNRVEREILNRMEQELQQRRTPKGNNNTVYNSNGEEARSTGRLNDMIIHIKNIILARKNLHALIEFVIWEIDFSGESIDKTCTRVIITTVLLTLALFTTIYTVNANNGNAIKKVSFSAIIIFLHNSDKKIIV